MKKVQLVALTFLFFITRSFAQEWQWMTVVDSVVSNENNDHPHAFLWIPPDCKQVKSVVVGQHNMIEEGIFENAFFRRTLGRLGFAEVWITPALDITFDFNKDAGKRFDEMMQSLATISGYSELAIAPVVPIGHSALASYPWNFAAWNPGRTLAVISVHGDAPLTKLTGSGRPNPEWGDRNIDGVPGLFIMGEYEWWEDRIQPAFDYINKHPKAAISLFADAGHGHFDYSDALIEYIAMFISKAASYRLPAVVENSGPILLRPVDPSKGWLMDRWRKDSLPLAKAAPYRMYKGPGQVSSWCFDEAMALTTEKYYAKARAKKSLNIGFTQNGVIVKPAGGHAQYNPPFIPLQDGISFNLKALFTDTGKMKPANEKPAPSPVITRICGPVKKINDTTFQLSFYRMGFSNPKRSNDIWLLASYNGDPVYKSAVQQLDMRFPIANNKGAEQHIYFPAIADQKAGVVSLTLAAVSDKGLPVYYYVKEGPAETEKNELLFTKIPPRSKLPLKVTVVAWQYGNAHEPKIQSAAPAERTFFIR